MCQRNVVVKSCIDQHGSTIYKAVGGSLMDPSPSVSVYGLANAELSQGFAVLGHESSFSHSRVGGLTDAYCPRG